MGHPGLLLICGWLREWDGRLFFQRDGDFAGVAAGAGDGDFAGGALADALELVAPLDEDQRVGREQFVEAQGFELALALQAVEREKLAVKTVYAMHQGPVPWDQVLAQIAKVRRS